MLNVIWRNRKARGCNKMMNKEYYDDIMSEKMAKVKADTTFV